MVALDYYTWSVDLPAFYLYRRDCEKRGITPRWPHEVPQLWRPESLPGKRGFDLAHDVLDSRVEPIVGDFVELDLGHFDVVLFLGVVYHLKDPLGAAERLRQVTRELAVIESEAIHVPDQEHLALWRFHGVDHLGGGPGNWWVPNRRALEHLFLVANFHHVETVDPSHAPTSTAVTSYRNVVHARP